jgi:REP element-mobilizing transposase RayT
MFEIVERSLLFGHKQTYLLHAYEIMCNHTHAVIEPLPSTPDPEGWTELRNYHRLEDILCGIKKHTSLEINRSLGRRGRFWMKEYFDRTIRGEKDLCEVIDYIHHNAVRWGLVEQPEEYRWPSLRTIYSGRPESDGWFDWSP